MKKRWTKKAKAIRNLLIAAEVSGCKWSIDRYKKMLNDELEPKDDK